MSAEKQPSKESDSPITTADSNKSSRLHRSLGWINKSLPAFHCILIGIAFTLATFRYFVTDSNDKYRCNAMLNDGQWLDEGLSSNKTLANWQPDGCMMQEYNYDKFTSCLKGRTLVFSGDSIVRRMYFGTIGMLDPKYDTAKLLREGKHRDFSVSAGGVELQFTWDPYLNSTRTINILERRDISHKNGSRPAIVVMGTGLWELQNLGDDAQKGYTEAIDRIVDATGPKAAGRPLIADSFVLIPVEHTNPLKIKPYKAKEQANPNIDALNDILREKLPPYRSSSISDISVLYAINALVASPVAVHHTTDGVHYGPAIVSTQVNLMLNLRCNDEMPKKFPFDKTCCTQYPAPNWMQTIIILFALIWAPLGLHYYASGGRPFYSRFFPAQHALIPMTIFGFSCVFMYFTDRTSLYLKIQKQFDFWPFTIAMILALVLGLVTMKKPEKDMGFLNRDQTDEWKGWMQIAILIYHYYYASRISGVYNPIRYLFMTGYGHFSFYYKKADYGLTRVAGVLVRLNLLTLALAYIQNTDYLSYYFSPLVTLWFGIIWMTMYIGYNHNKNTTFMLAKIAVSAALNAAFHMHSMPLQFVFGIFNTIFNTDWNAKEWSFRVTLDMYIVYVGMLAALLFIKIQEEKIWDRSWWPRVRTLSYLIALLGLAGYFAFELRYTKFEYNQYHPYVSFVPVISFVVLRNATPLLRSTSSRAYAWIGRCSLETFICQFHIWLAGDTKGLLVLLPWPRMRLLNMLFTTLVFLFVSNQIAVSTGQLTDWILGKQPKTAKTSEHMLPSTSTEALYVPLSTISPDSSLVEDVSEDIATPPSKLDNLLADVRFRCAVFMALVWIANLLYPSYQPSQGRLLPTH